MSYFSEPHTQSKNKIEFELDLANCATKSELENTADVETLTFSKKIDLTCLKSDVDELNINKLKNVPKHLGSLKSKVDKLDVDKLVTAPVDLKTHCQVCDNFQQLKAL